MAKIDSKGREIISNDLSGKVKWFNAKEGYGFITRNDNFEDVFVHNSDILNFIQSKSLDSEEDVEFDIIETVKGIQAVNVTGPNGNAVRGSKYSSRSRNASGTDSQIEFVRGGRGRFRSNRGAFHNTRQRNSTDESLDDLNNKNNVYNWQSTTSPEGSSYPRLARGYRGGGRPSTGFERRRGGDRHSRGVSSNRGVRHDNGESNDRSGYSRGRRGNSRGI